MRTDDGYIIQKCLDGDSTAFGLLVDKYSKSIYALAYSRIHNHHDAQDVTQEVFVKAYKDLRKLKRWDSFMGWLYRITVNLCKNWQRSESRRPDHEFAEDQDPIVLDNPSVITYEQDKVYGSIREALDSLPEMYHEVLALYYLEDMSIIDMSRFLGISSRTIDRRLNEARIRLKEEMIAMMSIEYKQHGLPANFTFQIVETVKRIKIHPISKISGLPWGLSLATGMIIAFLGFGSHLNLSNPLAYIMNSANTGKTSVIENGEIPVNVMDISNKPIFAGNQGNAMGIQNAFFMSPKDEGGKWTKKADMLDEKWAFSASVANGKIYAFGGTKNAGQVGFDAIDEYDPSKNTWIEKNKLPKQNAWLSTSEVNGMIYAIGGQWDDNFSSVYEYNPLTNTLAKKADMPTARAMFGTEVANGKIYAMGGWIGWNKGNMGCTAAVEEYDPISDKWTKKADMPDFRLYFTATTVNGRIYVIGGEWGVPVATVEEYDPINDSWKRKQDMPTAKQIHSAVVLNNKIYVLGGMTGNEGDAISTVEIYDPDSDKWEKAPDMSTARCVFSASVANGKIYAMGGATGMRNSIITGDIASVEEYTPEGWSVVSPQNKIATKWSQVRQSK
jgi:RNA polymerase sigma factor (sigma-70 family)